MRERERSEFLHIISEENTVRAEYIVDYNFKLNNVFTRRRTESDKTMTITVDRQTDVFIG